MIGILLRQIFNAVIVASLNVILSLGLVCIESNTNLSAKKETELVYELNKQRYAAGSNFTNMFELLLEYELCDQVDAITDKVGVTKIQWTFHDPPTVMKHIFGLLVKLGKSEDIEIVRYTRGRSIVTWFSFKTKEVLQKLRNIIESGDLQIYLTIIFTLLSHSSEELKVNIKEYTTDLKWAEDYFHEKG